MLELKNITKKYVSENTEVTALSDVSICFRDCEFVSVLGPSGCGKTTLLNVIGSLDHNFSGDLIINGKSTGEFSDGDWDAYRNNSIGFVFQSYNLIPHQTVLSNVELALTLSGVSRSERVRRAKEALKSVGLEDQIHKKPNQMSGGQMQRVAIARALVNNPAILLADEPTGALDSETSIQIMNILHEIARDRLVIMVTHNPELAEKYSTRIVRLLDGSIVSDSSPYNESAAMPAGGKKAKKPSMSFLTALSLSFNNLMTKKTRTILTSFAGSIGIIGIALILSLSNGVQAYINDVERNTLASYPITIEKTSVDMSNMMTAFMTGGDEKQEHGTDKIYSNNIMVQMIESTLSMMAENDLVSFIDYINGAGSEIKELSSDIKYGYSTVMNIYKSDTSDGLYKVNPSNVMNEIGYSSFGSSEESAESMVGNANSSVWHELLSNGELLDSQYETVAGRMPENYNEVVIAVNENNEISDYTLYSLGLLDIADLKQMMIDKVQGGGEIDTSMTSYSYDELLKLEFSMIVNSDYYEKTGETWTDRSSDDEYVASALAEKGITLKVVGIVRPADGSLVNVGAGYIGYLPALTEHLINAVNDSEVVKAQISDPETDIFTGIRFDAADNGDFVLTMDAVEQYIATLPESEGATIRSFIATMRATGMSDEAILKLMAQNFKRPTTDATYDGNLELLGVSDLKSPASVKIYPKDFEAKEKITALIDAYNSSAVDGKAIKYTDYIGLLLSSVTTIINAISYILIAFVSISLIVSSIMIGIITYISVLERTKEIGILRAIGASKRDISHVFNAETLTVGFIAGIFGIGITLLLTIPINQIIASLTSIYGLCVLPTGGAVVLIVISMLLTFIAGLIPSRIAAKKDPVVALRTE